MNYYDRSSDQQLGVMGDWHWLPRGHIADDPSHEAEEAEDFDEEHKIARGMKTEADKELTMERSEFEEQSPMSACCPEDSIDHVAEDDDEAVAEDEQ